MRPFIEAGVDHIVFMDMTVVAFPPDEARALQLEYGGSQTSFTVTPRGGAGRREPLPDQLSDVAMMRRSIGMMGDAAEGARRGILLASPTNQILTPRRYD